ncbi:hypothetical protein CU098_006730, partial [Rhizopus stolonifer]
MYAIKSNREVTQKEEAINEYLDLTSAEKASAIEYVENSKEVMHNLFQLPEYDQGAEMKVASIILCIFRR